VRVLTAPKIALLQGANRAHHQRIWFGPPGGALVDLSDYLLPGTLHEAGVNEQVDALTVHMDRSLGAASLSPLMTADPPIDLGHQVVWETAVTAQTVAPIEADWIELFRGTVRLADPSNNDMVVVCQDLAGTLNELYTLPGQTIAIDTELEDAIQEILDEAPGLAPTTLDVPVSPDASLTAALAISHEPVLRATQGLADSIGWSTRYKWHEAGAEFRFSLLEPPRDKTIPDWVTSPSRYLLVPELKLDKTDIRNEIWVYYGPKDPSGIQASFALARDDASIAKYGLLPMVLREGSDSPIQNSTQAQALADAALSDLSEPDVTHSFVDFDLPHLQPWDLIEFPPNNVHYSTMQRLSVQTIRREYPAPGVARITAGCRGKPSAGVGTWRRREKIGQVIDAVPPPVNPLLYGFIRFEEVETGDPAIRRIEYEAGPNVHSVWAAVQQYDYPLEVDAEADIKTRVTNTGTLIGSLTLPAPTADLATMYRAEPRYMTPDGLAIYSAGVDLVEQGLLYAEPAKIHGWIDAKYQAGILKVFAGANPTVSALPVTYEIRADSRTGAILAAGIWTTQAAAQAGIGGTGSLTNLAPPADGKKFWLARFTDVAGNEEWQGDSVENPVKPRIHSFAHIQGASTLTADISIVVESPLGRNITLSAWLNRLGTTHPDPAAAADATLALTFTPGTPGSTLVTSATTGWSTGVRMFDENSVFPGIGKVIYLAAVDDLGFGTGIQPFELHSWSTLQRSDGSIIDNAISRPGAIAASIRPLESRASRPAAGDYVGHRIGARDTGLAWEWTGSAWTPLLNGVDGFYYMPYVVASAVSTRELAAYAATIGKLNIASVFLSGFTISSNSPGAGSVAWSSGSVIYEGATYAVSGGATGDPIVWWDRSSPGAFRNSSNTDDLIADGYDEGDGDAVVIMNDLGTAQEIWNGTLIYGGRIKVPYLSAIKADLGTMAAGIMLDALSGALFAIRLSSGYAIPGSVTDFIDFVAAGSSAPMVRLGGLEVDGLGDTTLQGRLKLIQDDSQTSIDFYADDETTLIGQITADFASINMITGSRGFTLSNASGLLVNAPTHINFDGFSANQAGLLLNFNGVGARWVTLSPTVDAATGGRLLVGT
jgi:hypothetical protein